MNDRLRSRAWHATLLASAALATLATSAAAGPLRQVTIKDKGTDLSETPINVEVPASVTPGLYVLRSTSSQNGSSHAVPALVYKSGGKTYLGLVLSYVPDRRKTDTSETYTAETATSPSQLAPGVELKAEGSNIQVLVGGKPFTEYRPGGGSEGPKPFLYPVYGPTGLMMTRNYPMKNVEGEDRDHPHQRSLWFTHGKVNGIDFWSELRNHGSIKETKREQFGQTGSPIAVIFTQDDWLGPDGKKICEDERVMRFYSTKNVRFLDFDIVIRATAGDVTFGDTKEGMFGVRVASSMDVKRKTGGKITNAEGITDNPAWGKPSPWVDYVGPVEGQTVGIAILNHPDSFRFPTTWHVRDYGLFAANPFGWHDFGRKDSGDHTVPAGQSIQFRYRVVFHMGDTPSAHVPAMFQAYAKPAEIEVKAD